MGEILKIDDISVSYGSIRALSDVSMTVNEGDIVSLIGANGAGKSTLLKSISGTVRPRSGEIIFDGRSIIGKPASYIVKEGITLSPEGRQIFPRMSVEENLRMGAYTHKGKDYS